MVLSLALKIKSAKFERIGGELKLVDIEFDCECVEVEIDKITLNSAVPQQLEFDFS